MNLAPTIAVNLATDMAANAVIAIMFDISTPKAMASYTAGSSVASVAIMAIESAFEQPVVPPALQLAKTVAQTVVRHHAGKLAAETVTGEDVTLNDVAHTLILRYCLRLIAQMST